MLNYFCKYNLEFNEIFYKYLKIKFIYIKSN